MGLENSVSSYWKVSDHSQYLTSVAAHETDPLFAVASGAKESNLFIYELGSGPFASKRKDPEEFDFGSTAEHQPRTSSANYILTHHQTISLGGIHSLSWVSPRHPLASQGNVLATGHNGGLAHLILLPDAYSSNVPAEIVKRFNHNRHIPTNSGVTSTRIKHLQLTDDAWACCALSSMLTLCNENLFLWDSSRSDVPILRKRCKGSLCFGISNRRNGIVAVGGNKGISIKDVRASNMSGLSPPTDNDTPVSVVQWSADDDNIVAAVHDDNIVKVWDIRSQGPLSVYQGHTERINSLQWSAMNSKELFSSSNDGTIRTWSIEKSLLSKEMGMVPMLGAESLPQKAVYTENKDFDWIPNKSWKLYRQRLSRYDSDDAVACEYFLDSCKKGTGSSSTIFSSNKEFVALSSIQSPQSLTPSTLSIDSEGYVGVHTKDMFSSELESSLDVGLSSDEQHSSEDDFIPPSDTSSARSSLSSF